MCNICDNCPTLEEYKNRSPYDRENRIIYNEKHKLYEYWMECDDYFYSGILFTANYCPICGRRLNDG